MVPGGPGPQASAPSSARVPVVYQIDFTAVASGKHIASTKRRVRWRFGFANPEALAQGETGIACRGEEHDITLVWSVTSGKKLVLADGHEVHVSTSRGGIFDFGWTMKGNHVLKILAHASPPLSMTPGWRQYDFFVDGQSFFTFPKVFRLGLAAGEHPRGDPSNQSGGQAGALGSSSARMTARGYSNYTIPPASLGSGSNHIASIEAPRTPAEEDAYLQEAIKNSIEEAGTPGAGPGGASAAQSSQKSEDLLLLGLFGDSPAPTPGPLALPSQSGYDMAPAQGAYPPQNAGSALLALPPSMNSPYQGQPVTPSHSAPPTYGAAPTAFFGATYGSPPAPFLSPPIPPAGYGAPDFSSPQAQATPSSLGFTSPQGTMYQQIDTPACDPSQQFAAPPASPYGASGYDTSQQYAAPAPYGAPAPYDQSQQYVPAPQNIGFEPSPVPNQNGYAPSEEEVHVAPNIASDPAIFTMNQLSTDSSNPFAASTSASSNTGASLADQAFSKFANMDKFDLVSKREEKRSNPFDTTSSSISANVPLADMKKSTAPKKDIMRSPAAAPVAPAALVVSGQQTGNWGGGYEQYSAPPQQSPMSYGQPTPAYGQQPPMQQQPAYVQTTPAYGQQSPMQQPVYGQPAPMYSQQPPMQQQPSYGQHVPGYGQQPLMPQQPAYGQPAPAYGQQSPTPQYGQQAPYYPQQY